MSAARLYRSEFAQRWSFSHDCAGCTCAGWYEALDDETPREIAVKLELNETSLVALNVGLYKGLTSTAKLMAGTR